MPINKRLDELIILLIKERKIYNQAEFGKLTGYSKGYISQFKSGSRSISKQNVSKICEVFPCVNYNWLLNGEGEPINKATVNLSAPIQEEESVTIQSEAWQVIKQQAASLEAKDRQLDRVITLLENQIIESKKTAVRPEENVICADAVGSGNSK